MASESKITDLIKLAVSKIPNSLIFRRNVGDFKTQDGRYISIGEKGEADWQGFVGNQTCPNCDFPIHPKPIAIEVKADRKDAKQSADQKLWQKNVWERRGALYILAKSVSDLIAALDKDEGVDMIQENEFRSNLITKYLLEISPQKGEKNIMDCLSDAASILGVSIRTVHRWRSSGRISTAEHIVSMLILINKKRRDLGISELCGIKDIAILCNFRGKFSDPSTTSLKLQDKNDQSGCHNTKQINDSKNKEQHSNQCG